MRFLLLTFDKETDHPSERKYHWGTGRKDTCEIVKAHLEYRMLRTWSWCHCHLSTNTDYNH